MNLQKKVLGTLTILSIFLTLALTSWAVGETSAEECSEDNAEQFIQGFGCATPEITGSYQIKPQEGKTIESSINKIEVSNPFAAAGQPVVVRFTLANIGDQAGFPFNQIPLPPDNYALTLVMDKDLGVVLEDGRVLDIWAEMSSLERMAFVFQTGTSQFYELAKNELKGEQCGYVRMNPHITDRIKNWMKDNAGNKEPNVYTWQCLRIVDKPLFDAQLKSYCKDNIDNACISRMNRELGSSVSDTVTVLLSSEVPKNTCE